MPQDTVLDFFRNGTLSSPHYSEFVNFLLMAKADRILITIVQLLKEEFSPSRLYLFGSRAAKTAKADSDYDFVMVLPKYTGDRMKMWGKCRELIRKKCGVTADVFTYSEKEFQKSIEEFSSIPETALNTGREIDLGSA